MSILDTEHVVGSPLASHSEKKHSPLTPHQPRHHTRKGSYQVQVRKALALAQFSAGNMPWTLAQCPWLNPPQSEMNFLCPIII